MTFFNFSQPRAVFAAVSLFALLSASAVGNDLEPLEDVTKLEKPTICYVDFSPRGVFLIDWDGRNNRLWLKGGHGLPVWSMDGKHVYVQGINDYVLNLRTGAEINVTERVIQRMGFDLIIDRSAWMPGSKQLVCEVGDQPSELYMLTVSAGEMVNITNTPGRSENQVTVSPDGKIAFSANAKEPFHRDHTRDIFIMNADGTDVKNITNTPDTSERLLAWSPDGKKIAFERLGGVYTMNPDGSNTELIMPPKGLWSVQHLTWSPDSKWIVYGVYWNAAYIARAHVETKEIVRITPGSVDAAFGSWVLAGKSRFLSVNPAGKKHAQWGLMKKAEAERPVQQE